MMKSELISDEVRNNNRAPAPRFPPASGQALGARKKQKVSLRFFFPARRQAGSSAPNIFANKGKNLSVFARPLRQVLQFFHLRI